MLIVLGERYLPYDPRPQPLTWKETAAQLANLQPEHAGSPNASNTW
ncbi:hypothetical protein N8J89_19925 [Crossiella sp. CA-258035]|nr:hypothetical protein [Crossiella sp. CA-258035]WHT23255.1 hypothetical protein N8J89_19925 [Crossiella sp. CA-258035]